MANRIRPIVVSEADRRELERVPRSPSAPAGFSRRARTVLLMAQGLAGVEIAERTGIHRGASQPAPSPVRGAWRRGPAGTVAFGSAADDHGPEAG